MEVHTIRYGKALTYVLLEPPGTVNVISTLSGVIHCRSCEPLRPGIAATRGDGLRSDRDFKPAVPA